MRMQTAPADRRNGFEGWRISDACRRQRPLSALWRSTSEGSVCAVAVAVAVHAHVPAGVHPRGWGGAVDRPPPVLLPHLGQAS
jgi:hypothetical protein